MDSRGIPIVLPGNKYASSPKRSTKSKSIRRDIPSSPFFVSSIKNEPSLLEVYDSFADACFNSHYNHSMLNDDYRYNIQDFHKTNIYPSDNMPIQPTKRFKSTNDSEISYNVPELHASSNKSICHSSQASSQPSEYMNYESEYNEESGSDWAGVAPNVQMRQPVTTKDALTQSISLNSCTIDFPEEERVQSDSNALMEDVDMFQELNLEAFNTHNDDFLEMITDEELNTNTNLDKISNTNIPENTINLLDEMKENEKATRYNSIHINIVDIPPQLSTPIECNHDPVTTVIESIIEDEQVSVIQNEQDAVTEPTIEKEQVSVTEPAIENEQISLTEPVIENEQLSVAEPTIENKQTSVTEPTTVNEPAIEELQVSVAESAIENLLVSVAQPAMENLQMSVNESTNENPQVLVDKYTSENLQASVIESTKELSTIEEPESKDTVIKENNVDPSIIEPPKRQTRSRSKVINTPPPTPTRRSTRIKVAASPTTPKVTKTRKSSVKTNESPKSPKFKQPKRTTKKQAQVEHDTKILEKVQQQQKLIDEEKKIELEYYDELRRARDAEEIKKINQDFPSLKESYELVERAGRGTFSKVYKAKDLLADEYIPLDEKYKVKSTNGDSYVAIKVIFDISSPRRVADEIECLAMFRDSPCITPLITAFRHEAITYVVLPYIEYDHFDDFFLKMTMNDIRSYVSQLLVGLKSVHEKNIMHRDVKPGNFLYSNKTGVGYLSDFGLAQKMRSLYPLGGKTVNSTHNYTQRQSEPGFYMYDRRLPYQANRSGTKGFRAPEIMLKYINQTTAIDIWAVGVIILIVLSGKYPFFNPDDDADGILEISHLFGKKKLKRFTDFYGRKLQHNIPSIPEEECNLAELCRTLNKERVDAWDSQEYNLAIDLMKQCLELIHTDRCTASEALNHPFFK